MDEMLEFKFKFVNTSGETPVEEGFFSKRGRLTHDLLTLDGTEIPVFAVAQAVARHGWLILGLLQQDGRVAPVVLSVKRPSTREVLCAINRAASRQWAEAKQERLKKEGRGGEFRTATCPYCGCTVDLCGIPASPQFLCRFCDTIVTGDGVRAPDEAKYRLCDQCGFYAQPKDFTVFYFWFALVVYGWSYRRLHLCNACMRKEVWPMFFANLLFVLGVPTALYQLVRAYAGGSALSQHFGGLGAANVRARDQRADEAAGLYALIEARLPRCAGVRYNHGLTFVQVLRDQDAAEQFMLALQDCANFLPAYEKLCACLKRLGREDDLKALRKVYGDETQEAGKQAEAKS